MARSFARLPLARPGDDWSQLRPHQQWAISLLERLPKVNFAGCVDVKLSRWVPLTAGVTEEDLVAVLEELERLGWIRWDRVTEELALRDHCRQDHVLASYKSARGLWGAWESIESEDIRTWLLEHFPDTAWDEQNNPRTNRPDDRITPLTGSDPCGKPTDQSPIDHPSDHPSEAPSDHPSHAPSDHPSEAPSNTDRCIQPPAHRPQTAEKSRDGFYNATDPPVDNSELRTTRLVNQLTTTAGADQLPPKDILRAETHHVIDDQKPDATDDQVLNELTRRVTHPNRQPVSATR